MPGLRIDPAADAITCPTCGEPVLQSERKVVSVLFADLAGYTALAEALIRRRSSASSVPG